MGWFAEWIWRFRRDGRPASRPDSQPAISRRTPPEYCPGHQALIGKALGLGDLRYRSLVLHEPVNGVVTVTVECLVTKDQADGLAKVFEERRYYLAEDKPVVAQGEEG